jgi:dihydroorotase-like cyclic amidohydrolase
MTLEQLVRVSSEGPAKIWGLYPQKGALRVGSDGDLTLLDLEQTWTIDEARLHSKHSVTPFHGLEVTGRPVGTIIRGRVVMEDGVLVDEPRGRPVIPASARRPAAIAGTR